MVSLSDFLFMFLCMFSIYKLLQFIYRLLQFIYKTQQFILQKISPLPKKDVQVPPLNHSPPASSSLSSKYDVFLSFRGEDVRKNFVDHFYSALVDRQIQTYKDDETLPRGESIGSSLLEAIEESRTAIIIFSKNYANSSWCLDELAHIMKCRDERGLIVMPIFYDVDPSEVRKQKGNFGKEFSKQADKNTTKAKLWIKALVDASNISGWEPKSIANGHEAQAIKNIVDVIFDRLSPLNSDIDENLVGMRDRLQDLETHLDIESNGVRMVGIWGVGGSGKTTLATSAYMKISNHYQGHCIMENVREEVNRYGLRKLQENMLSVICKIEVKVHSIDEGKLRIKNALHHRKVLVVLDDVDTLGQLEALVGNHNWFGSGSKIIITTRDEHLLKAHKVDHIYPVILLSNDEAIRLFKRHAYNEEDPIEDYETFSLRVVSYASGLPLLLKILGSFLYDKNKKEWISALKRLKDIPNKEVNNILKISYDGLEPDEKELFLHIACFFRGHDKSTTVEILEACDYYPEIGIKVLIQKALITIKDGDMLDMHDLVQEMGHYIVRGEHLNNPEKHSRLWKPKEIVNMPFWDETMEYDKIEAINYDYNDKHNNGDSLCLYGTTIEEHDKIQAMKCIYNHENRCRNLSRLCKIVSKMKKLRLLIVNMHCHHYHCSVEGVNFLSNELRYIELDCYPTSSFPESFQPTNLVILKLSYSKQQELWKGYKHLPKLKELHLVCMKNLLSTPDFDGIPCLQKLRLHECWKLKEIHPSLGNHTSLEYLEVSCCEKLKRLPTISQMKNIKVLLRGGCYLEDGDMPCGIDELSNLEELNLSINYFSRLDFSLSQLTRLKVLNLSSLPRLLELPDQLPSSLTIFTTYGCWSLTIAEDFNKNCKELCQVSLNKDYGWSKKLLESMLKGKAVENGCIMYLKLEGAEIPKVFRHPLHYGPCCRLELPENWCTDFSGFLMCLVNSFPLLSNGDLCISSKDASSMNSQIWKEPISGNRIWTFWWYVSFDSLRHTVWWDPTYKALEFRKEGDHNLKGFGVRLVKKRSRSGLTETTETLTDSSSHNYTPKIKIRRDSASELRVQLIPYEPCLY